MGFKVFILIEKNTAGVGIKSIERKFDMIRKYKKTW